MRRVQGVLVALVLTLVAILNYVTDAPAHMTIISVVMAVVALGLTGRRKEQNE